ncbi:hypothetical protein [Kribbella sp. CA-294648]|uniref:hypothetical protein n=1 Tax=Kribbella sp. CA-294648 TaxID=3239948 RepID=UPI003D8C8249
MTSGDLKYLLQGLADDGAELVEVDKEQLVPRIRSRRRRRAALMATVAASTAVMLAAGAYAVLPGSGPEQWPVAGGPPTSAPTLARPAAPTMTVSTEKKAWDTCGARLTATITGDPSLRIMVTTRKVKLSADGASGWVPVHISNTTGRTLDLASATDGPRFVVVKDGGVVALTPREPMAGRRWLFLPRQTATVVTALSVRPCGTGRGLDPGSYQIYALKTFNENRPGYPFVQLQAAGGPWTIQVS